MRKLRTFDSLTLAAHWQNLFEQAGFAVHLRNQFASSAVGEIPVDQGRVQLWLNDAGDWERAQTLLAQLDQPEALAAWLCAQCGERSDGQFSACWKCGSEESATQ